MYGSVTIKKRQTLFSRVASAKILLIKKLFLSIVLDFKTYCTAILFGRRIFFFRCVSKFIIKNLHSSNKCSTFALANATKAVAVK